MYSEQRPETEVFPAVRRTGWWSGWRWGGWGGGDYPGCGRRSFSQAAPTNGRVSSPGSRDWESGPPSWRSDCPPARPLRAVWLVYSTTAVTAPTSTRRTECARSPSWGWGDGQSWWTWTRAGISISGKTVQLIHVTFIWFQLYLHSKPEVCLVIVQLLRYEGLSKSPWTNAIKSILIKLCLQIF